MENIKEIILPDGWVIDKVENGKIILREDDSKPVIKWNNEKNGVEVKADGYHFIVASMPTNIQSDWDSAKIICEKWGGYLPSVEELQVMCKYIKEINRCFKNNNGFECLTDLSVYFWSDYNLYTDHARAVHASNGYVCCYVDKTNYYNVKAFLRI